MVSGGGGRIGRLNAEERRVEDEEELRSNRIWNDGEREDDDVVVVVDVVVVIVERDS